LRTFWKITEVARIFGDFFHGIESCVFIFTKMGWAAFRAILSQSHLVALFASEREWQKSVGGRVRAGRGWGAEETRKTPFVSCCVFKCVNKYSAVEGEDELRREDGRERKGSERLAQKGKGETDKGLCCRARTGR
jgi:hypothetical protein